MPPSKCALDAHEQPSAELRAEWKLISRLTPLNIEQDAELLDDPRAASPESGFENADPIKRQQLEVAFASLDAKLANLAVADSPVVYHKLLPGTHAVVSASGSHDHDLTLPRTSDSTRPRPRGCAGRADRPAASPRSCGSKAPDKPPYSLRPSLSKQR